MAVRPVRTLQTHQGAGLVRISEAHDAYVESQKGKKFDEVFTGKDRPGKGTTHVGQREAKSHKY